MTPIPNLRTLVKVKDRRLGPLDAALRASRQQAAHQQAALDEAKRQELACREEERALRSGLHKATHATGGLRGSDIVARQLQLDDAARRIASAGKATEQAIRQAESARQQVRTAQRALQRGQEKLDRSREQLDHALRALDQTHEDAQDEEAGEVAAARLSAHSREEDTSSP